VRASESRHHSILQTIRSGHEPPRTVAHGWTHRRRLPNQSVDPDLARTNGSLPLLPPGPFLREQGRTRTGAEAEAERDGEIEGEDERRGAMISPSFIITSPHQPRPLVVTTRPCNPHHRRPLSHHYRNRTHLYRSRPEPSTESSSKEFAVAVAAYAYKPFPIQYDTTESLLLIFYYPLFEERE
jgi:hypothetical protein